MPNTIALPWMVGQDCHDAAHGFERRPFSGIERRNWKRIVHHWVKQGRLRYSEVRTIAEELGRDESRPREDEALRVEFARRLELVALTRPKFTPDRLKMGRLIAAVEALDEKRKLPKA